MEGVKLRSGKVQVWSRSGPGLVQFTAQILFSFELDSEVGRLVLMVKSAELKTV